MVHTNQLILTWHHQNWFKIKAYTFIWSELSSSMAYPSASGLIFLFFPPQLWTSLTPCWQPDYLSKKNRMDSVNHDSLTGDDGWSSKSHREGETEFKRQILDPILSFSLINSALMKKNKTNDPELNILFVWIFPFPKLWTGEIPGERVVD